ncbi:hypothetical protein [Actinomadura latina]|uniref:Uncharacterized protein n=1 Tax=Actinomadura latina TaxID=163603 RepID=A0A846Z5X4_9ACTN|nr:hypothetical protein [Actinomadura latina]NKZ07227.1 hypothetical protein [Actinomadura latina]
MIGEAAARLPGGRALQLAGRIRALPVLGPPELALLRRCGGVPTRDDLERALAAAPTGEEAVLREAFGLGPTPEDGHRLPSRERLDELIAAFPAADAGARGALLDRMLDDPARAVIAARTLLGRPEPETRAAVLRAYLDGKADLPVTDRLALALCSVEPSELDAEGDDVQERAARLIAHLAPASRAPFVPMLLEWWTGGPPSTREAAERALCGAHPTQVAGALTARLDAGAWGVLDLLRGARLRRTPALTRAWQRLRAEGREDQIERITLVEGPLREPGAAAEDAAALAALRDRIPPARRERPSREDLLRTARTGAGDWRNC